MRVMAACVDTGGHHAASVFSFCRAHHRRRIFPTRGIARSRPIWNARPSAAGFKGQDRVYLVGVDTAKDALYARLSAKNINGCGRRDFVSGKALPHRSIWCAYPQLPI